ncbi:MAG: penicillin-binding protein 2, partial [Lactobacillaceae bacterium]|nr:penicillin-binding protein 2 [Lactobacillaceae bacterium]
MQKNVKNPIVVRSKRATKVLFFVFVVFFVFFIFTFVKFTVLKEAKGRKIDSSYYTRFINQQNQQPTRGNILTSDGHVLAEQSVTYDMYAILSKSYVGIDNEPLYVKNVKNTAKQLAKVIDMKESDILKRLKPRNKDTYQVEFGNAGKNLSIAMHNKIEKLKLSGIKFTENKSRLYPDESLASNIIGITQNIEDKKDKIMKMTGVMGIEQSYNKYLSGSNDNLTGNDVYLTLNSRLQQILENQMNSMYDQVKPKQTVAVIMNAKTGAILAATQRPNFNGNTKKGIDKAWSNLLVQNPYEPGSTMKTITLSAAINEGKWDPNATFQSGTLKVGGGVVNDAESDLGVISFRKGYAFSSNVAFSLTEQKLGDNKWLSYIKKFQFLKTTNVGFDDESAGSINFDSELSRVNTSFGQAITVTPAQLLRAYSAEVNGGHMVEPHIVEKVVSSKNKVVKNVKVSKSKKILKKSTTKKVISAMEDVVNMSQATGGFYSLEDEGYKVAAKTGTAQLAKNGVYTNSYLDSTHSVVMIVPADDPQYIVMSYVMQPKSLIGGYADQTQDFLLKPVVLQALADFKSTKTTKKSI